MPGVGSNIYLVFLVDELRKALSMAPINLAGRCLGASSDNLFLPNKIHHISGLPCNSAS